MKKKILIICSTILILGIGGILIFLNLSKKKNNSANNFSIPNINIDYIFEKLENNDEIIVKKDLELVIGSKVPTASELTGQELEAEVKVYFNNELLSTDILSSPGTYNIEIIVNNEVYTTTIVVKDISSPNLVLNTKTIYYGDTYNINDFVKECLDDSNEECRLSYKNNKMANYKKIGSYDIVIVANDSSGNTIEQTTKLVIKKKKHNTITNNNDSPENNSNNSNDGSNEEITIVDTITETTTSTTTKYGVKITDTINITYNVYSDGTKVETSRKKIKTSYDYSGYNATTDDLKSEAITLTNNNTTKANDVLGYLNTYRSEVGVNPLQIDRTLTIAANIRALELAYSQKFSHERPNGSKFHTVINEIGGSWSYVGENIAGGYTSAKSVSEAWKNSSGHYANMINENYNKVGIGYVYVDGMDYWVQLFSN